MEADLQAHTAANSLLVVCDDAGFASVDRGIRLLVEQTGKPVCAEYLIEQPGAVKRAQAMATNPLVTLGLHFELSSTTDADRVALTRTLQEQGTSLGEQPHVQQEAKEDARRQLSVFREALGKNPGHISTHGNFNTDAQGNVLPWWLELMEELFEGDVPPMQLSSPHIRHNLYSWNVSPTQRAPRTPEEFLQELRKFAEYPPVEFVMHPAFPKEGDAPLDMLFTADMRKTDLACAVAILNSGIIEQAGFRVVPVSLL